ncbi:hypothetical protein [Terriglobus albidus]|uniref:hypothetical protein n=1 Tax=Terriglobus albidus TaxID=1592106 RepID=UPI0021DFD948|nr:hypothetical protein [Terriglobus albidus]
MSVTGLYQRLKELSKNDFEALIDTLLQARFPSAGITRVDGAGGDKGVDSYHGRLKGGLSVWQDKHFPNGIKSSQKRNILESIGTVFKNYHPVQWTLCIPIDLTPEAREWFDSNVVDAYSSKASIELLQASNIVYFLLQYKKIRETFFPDVISDQNALRSMIMNSDNLSGRQKGILGGEYVSQYIADLESLDERFSYEVIVGGSLPARDTRNRPGLLASIFDGRQTLNVLANDRVALQDDPIKFLVSMSRKAAERMHHSIKTGHEVRFTGEEFVKLELPRPISEILDQSKFELKEVRFQPRWASNLKSIPVKMIIPGADPPIRYEYVSLRVKYLGTDEVTFESEGALPIKLLIVASLTGDNRCLASFEVDCPGKTFRSISQAITFTDAIMRGEEFHVEGLENPEFSLKIQGVPENQDEDSRPKDALRAFVDDALIVSKYLGSDLVFPDQTPITDDYEFLSWLKLVATGEEFEIQGISFTMTKDSSLVDQVELISSANFGAKMAFRIDSETRVLFGMPIRTGDQILEVDKITLDDLDGTVRRLKAAPEKGAIDVRALGPSKARYVRQLQGVPSASPASLGSI